MRNEESSKGLADLIFHIKSSAAGSRLTRVLEIGSFSGESTVQWCNNFPEVHCVDPWDYKEGGLITLPEGHEFSEIEAAFDHLMPYFRTTLHKHKMTSHEFAQSLVPSSLAHFDVIYIDGDHTFEGVNQDIKDWLHRCCGWMCGHDYDDPRYPGIRTAVDMHFSHVILFRDKSWAVRL